MPKILRGEFQTPRTLAPDYPRELERIICKALSTDPRQRYATAAEMQSDLEMWIAASGAGTRADVAQVVHTRLSEARRALVEGLEQENKLLPDRLARLLDSPHEQTPTPASGLVSVPETRFDTGGDDAQTLVVPPEGTHDRLGEPSSTTLPATPEYDASPMGSLPVLHTARGARALEEDDTGVRRRAEEQARLEVERARVHPPEPEVRRTIPASPRGRLGSTPEGRRTMQSEGNQPQSSPHRSLEHETHRTHPRGPGLLNQILLGVIVGLLVVIVLLLLN